MVFIVLSVIQSVLILITFKLFNRFRIDNLVAIVVNYLVAASFGFTISQTGWSPATVTGFSWFATSMALGILFISTFFMFALSSQKVGVAVTSVTSKMSLVIPVIASMIFWGETLNTMRAAGIVMALMAFYLTFKQKHGPDWKSKYAWIPFLVFAGNGLVDTTMKYADYHHIRNDLVLFLAFVFLTAFIIGSTILLIRVIRNNHNLNWRSVPGGVFLGLINFGSTFYMLKAISVFESSVVFPVTNASIVGLTGLAGYFGFREKLSWLNWTGIILAILAILVIAKA